MSHQSDLIFDALGDPVRRRILELLGRGPTPVGVLARELPVGRPAVSKHLKVLTVAGLTQTRAVGTSNLYSLHPQGMETARHWLTDTWDAVLQSYSVAARRKSETTRPQTAAIGSRQSKESAGE